MIKKLLIVLGSLITIFILIGIIAIVTGRPAEEPAQITPTPTTPEQQAITPAEQAYATTIGNQATTVGNAFTELTELCQNPQFGNDEWTLLVAVQLTTIRMAYDEAMELDPPSSMAEIHLKYTQGMKAYNDMAYLFARGVDELDPNLIEEATRKMEIGTQLINEAAELTREFTEAHK